MANRRAGDPLPRDDTIPEGDEALRRAEARRTRQREERELAGEIAERIADDLDDVDIDPESDVETFVTEDGEISATLTPGAELRRLQSQLAHPDDLFVPLRGGASAILGTYRRELERGRISGLSEVEATLEGGERLVDSPVEAIRLTDPERFDQFWGDTLVDPAQVRVEDALERIEERRQLFEEDPEELLRDIQDRSGIFAERAQSLDESYQLGRGRRQQARSEADRLADEIASSDDLLGASDIDVDVDPASFDVDVGLTRSGQERLAEERAAEIDQISSDDVDVRFDDGRVRTSVDEDALREAQIGQAITEQADLDPEAVATAEIEDDQVIFELTEEERRRRARQQIAEEDPDIDPEDIAAVDFTNGDVDVEFTDEFLETQAREQAAEDLGVDPDDLEVTPEGDVMVAPDVREDRAREQLADEVGLPPDEVDIEREGDSFVLGDETQEQLLVDQISDEHGVDPDDIDIVDEGDELRAEFETEQEQDTIGLETIGTAPFRLKMAALQGVGQAIDDPIGTAETVATAPFQLQMEGLQRGGETVETTELDDIVDTDFAEDIGTAPFQMKMDALQGVGRAAEDPAGTAETVGTAPFQLQMDALQGVGERVETSELDDIVDTDLAEDIGTAPFQMKMDALQGIGRAVEDPAGTAETVGTAPFQMKMEGLQRAGERVDDADDRLRPHAEEGRDHHVGHLEAFEQAGRGSIELGEAVVEEGPEVIEAIDEDLRPYAEEGRDQHVGHLEALEQAGTASIDLGTTVTEEGPEVIEAIDEDLRPYAEEGRDQHVGHLEAFERTADALDQTDEIGQHREDDVRVLTGTPPAVGPGGVARLPQLGRDAAIAGGAALAALGIAQSETDDTDIHEWHHEEIEVPEEEEEVGFGAPEIVEPTEADAFPPEVEVPEHQEVPAEIEEPTDPDAFGPEVEVPAEDAGVDAGIQAEGFQQVSGQDRFEAVEEEHERFIPAEEIPAMDERLEEEQRELEDQMWEQQDFELDRIQEDLTETAMEEHTIDEGFETVEEPLDRFESVEEPLSQPAEPAQPAAEEAVFTDPEILQEIDQRREAAEEPLLQPGEVLDPEEEILADPFGDETFSDDAFLFPGESSIEQELVEQPEVTRDRDVVEEVEQFDPLSDRSIPGVGIDQHDDVRPTDDLAPDVTRDLDEDVGVDTTTQPIEDLAAEPMQAVDSLVPATATATTAAVPEVDVHSPTAALEDVTRELEDVVVHHRLHRRRPGRRLRLPDIEGDIADDLGDLGVEVADERFEYELPDPFGDDLL